VKVMSSDKEEETAQREDLASLVSAVVRCSPSLLVRSLID